MAEAIATTFADTSEVQNFPETFEVEFSSPNNDYTFTYELQLELEIPDPDNNACMASYVCSDETGVSFEVIIHRDYKNRFFIDRSQNGELPEGLEEAVLHHLNPIEDASQDGLISDAMYVVDQLSLKQVLKESRASHLQGRLIKEINKWQNGIPAPTALGFPDIIYTSIGSSRALFVSLNHGSRALVLVEVTNSSFTITDRQYGEWLQKAQKLAGVEG